MQLPKYLTVKQLTDFNKIKWMEGVELYIYTVHVISGMSIHDIRQLPYTELKQIYLECASLITNIDTKFYPVIEWNGKTYGFSHMKKMSTGEYADLDFLTTNTEQNLPKIMSILFRPVTKNKLTSFKFKFNQTIKYWYDDVEEPWDYYEIEPYTSKNDANWDDFPAGIAMASLGFFLQLGNKSVVNTLIYSHNDLPEVKKMVKMFKTKMKEMKSRSKSIMAGLQSLRRWQTPQY